ncbi:MAG: FecR domain-containing protein [Acidobacteria bacterium]|nr:FecR domain-containing protein [Acidobacteriota bacterium]
MALGAHLRAADLTAAAKVALADGRVSVLRNGDLLALFAGNTVRVGETIVTGEDGIARLEISDGSSFEVYPNSRVVFRANPGNLRDLVEIYLGKIKVRIQHLGGRPNFYRVHSPTAVISVRGTVFDVAVEADTETWVAVDEGLVIVEHRLLPSGKTVPLAPGESLRIFPNSPLAAAGVNKAGVAARVADAAREALWVLRTIGGRSGAGGGKAPGPGPAPAPAPVPTDTQAPPPPPPPPPPPGGP